MLHIVYKRVNLSGEQPPKCYVIRNYQLDWKVNSMELLLGQHSLVEKSLYAAVLTRSACDQLNFSEI